MSKKKKPKFGATVVDNKKPIVKENPDSYKSKNPVWAFSRAKRGKWTIFCSDFYENCIPKLMEFETMTWNEIDRETHNKGKSCNHHFTLDAMVKDASSQFNPEMDNTDALYSLRIDGTRRLIGYLENGTFYIIWYDQNHEVLKTNIHKSRK